MNFYEITGEDLIFERTFERGVEDFTYACGTGTGSVVTVLTLQGKVSGHGVQVDMTGGRLVIDAERVHSHIASLYLTGPTNVVCRGEVTDEEPYYNVRPEGHTGQQLFQYVLEERE